MSARLSNLGFVFALLVVAIHVHWPPLLPARFAFAFHVALSAAVPFFFAVSGFFLARHWEEPGWWRTAVVKRMRTLAIPYFAWSAVAMAVIAACGAAANLFAGRPPLHGLHVAPDGFRAFFGLNLFCYPELGPLWYVRCLLLFVLAAPLFKRLDDRLGWALPPAALALSIAVQMSLDGGTGSWAFFFSNGFSLWGLSFFLLGIRLRRGATPVETVVRRAFPTALAALGITLASRALLPAGAAKAMPLLNAAAVVSFLVVAVRLAPSRPWPKALTSSAFPIFVLHWILFYVYAAVFGVAPAGLRAWPYRIAQWCVGVGGSIAIAGVVNQTCPRVAAWLFGGRTPSREGSR